MLNARSYSRPAAPSLQQRTGDLLVRLWHRLRVELTCRRDIQHLRRLGDEHLADLGLTRGSIEGAVRGQHDPQRSRR